MLVQNRVLMRVLLGTVMDFRCVWMEIGSYITSSVIAKFFLH